MKNFTRFLALTLAILFAVGTISVAATQFPDVDESNPYAKEIDVVSSMGIVTGAKGMFNDGKVARWQFTVYAAKALTGVTSDDVWTKNENNTTFTDLASRTAPAAVSWAVSNDLIKGRSTTEFDPYTTITLAEASAIMVRALGYDYDVRYNAEQPSAWKWAYLTKAMELGVTKGLESAALSPDHEVTKSEAALLIYNTLFITRKNGSTISDKIWGGVEVGEDAVAQQFIITAVKVGNDTDQLANTYALHSFAGVKLNGFADGKVDEDITLYLTSDEFKDLTGVDAKTVLTKGYVGASLDALYAADGQEIEELSLNAPADPYAGLIVGGEFDDTAKTLTVKGVTFDYATTDFYVTHESQKGYPALRDPAVYKMSTREQVCYGVNGEEVVDRVGNKFFLDIDDNIVAENVHDTNSVAYVGVIVSGQYGKFESSAEIDSQYVGEELNVDGNYRVATEADLAKAALVDTVYETPAKANEATFEQAKKEIAYGKYSVTAFDDDGDGVADRIFITGTAYNESILRIVPAEKKVKILQQNNDGVPGWVDLVTTGNKDALSRNVRINNTEIKTFTDLNKASDNDFFIAMVPDAGTIEFVEWIPYLYGEIVNLAELVNPTVDYDVTTAVIGILDKTTNVRSDYFVDINPVLYPNINNAKEAWKYRYNKVAVDVAADVDWLVGDPTSEHPTFKDRSVLVSQWVKYIALPTTVIAGAKDGKATGTKATEPKEMILYITQDKGDNIDGIYVSSLVAGETASFTFYDLKNGERKTIDNVSLYDTIFNDNSLVWVKQLKSNLAIDNGNKNFAYVANPETASVASYKNLDQLFADNTKTFTDVAENYTLTEDDTFQDGKAYYTLTTVGGGTWTQEQIDEGVGLDAFEANKANYYILDGGKYVPANAGDLPEAGIQYVMFVQDDNVVVGDDIPDDTYYVFTEADVEEAGHYTNLVYLTFQKDNVGDFYTVKAGAPVAWNYTNMTKDVEGYKVLQNYVYLKNPATNHANNKFYFVKGTDYDADEVEGIIHTTDKYYTNFAGGHAANDEGAVTYEYANESSKFTTAYKKIDDFSTFTVAAAIQIGQFWFSPGIEYSSNAKTPVVGYDNENNAITSTFDVVYDNMTKAEKAKLSKVDKSFTVYTYTEGDDIQTTKTSNTSNDASVIVASADAEYKIDGNKLFLYTPAVADDPGTVEDEYEPATLTAKGVLTSAQVAKFAKKISGYTATETFISVGNATEWNLADYITKNNATPDTYNAVENPVVEEIDNYYELIDEEYVLTQDDDINDLKTYYTLTPAQAATLVYLKKDVPVAVADFTAEELAKAMEVLTANAWSEDGTNGIVVIAKEVNDNSEKDKNNNPINKYRYGYTVKGDTISNLGFLKVSGVNYDGKAFSALMQLDGASIGSVNDDTKFVVISAQDVTVAADKKSYTQLDGYTFTSMNLSEISAETFKMAVYQYRADFAVGKSATYVFLFGYVIPGDTGTVELTTLTHATVDGLTKGVKKTLSVGEYTYTVTPEEGYPNISVTVDGKAVVPAEDGSFKVTVKKDTDHKITVECSETQVDKGAVAVNVTKGKVTFGENTVTNNGAYNLPVGEYTFTVTPDEGYPIITAQINGELVEVDENGSFTLNVEKNGAYTVTVVCSAVRYIFLKSDFNSTVGYEGNEIWFTWTTPENAAYDVFTSEKISGAVYETYQWKDTNYDRIYTGAGIYAVEGVESKFGTGKYKLVKSNDNPNYLTDGDMNTFLRGSTALKTGAFYGTEMENTILFFDLGVTDYVYTPYKAATANDDEVLESATAKVSYARRTAKMYEDFIFVRYTEEGVKTITAKQYKDKPGDYNIDDPANYKFVPWNLGASYAAAEWAAGQTATTEQLAAVANNASIAVTSITFKYTETADGKIIVFVNSVMPATLTSTK